ncbi:MAG: chorismate synthase [Atopobiaceae bacterium]|jgi:chorismate synthase|nr:chorismate synthase [Atopobiaceae bacterium]
MPSSFGTALRVTVFGQSHSEAIGCVVEGLPSGFAVDQEALRRFCARRAPGRSPWSTARKEPDEARIVSGLNRQGRTCGAPLAAVIENVDVRSGDYAGLERVPRPGHADFSAQAKWHGEQDVAGGGHFSGRLTAPLCVAGGIALQVLEAWGVRVAAHLDSVAGVDDVPFASAGNGEEDAETLAAQMDALADGRAFPCIDLSAGERMRAEIEAARSAGDSVGGVVETVATGMPAGVGSPMLDGLESLIARIAFAIPAVKGVEFGAGFDASRLYGSEDNDPFGIVSGRPAPLTNNAGGILGGISTGAPIAWRMSVKPTPSIAIEQDSVDLAEGRPAKLVVRGRHDPCIAPRAVPVAEAACALALLDAWLAFPPEAGMAGRPGCAR